MAVYLIFTLPGGEDTKVHLSSKLTVGRGENCDVVLPDSGVSSTHAEISLTPEGKVLVQDLKSSNGTTKNGDKIKKCFLQVNDILKLYKVKVRIDRARLSQDEIDNIGITKMADIDNEDLTLPAMSMTKTKKTS